MLSEEQPANSVRKERAYANSLRIFIGILLLLVVGVSFNSISPWLRVIGTAVYALAALSLLIRYRHTSLKSSPLDFLILIFLAFEALTLLWTPFPQPAAEQLIIHILLYTFFILIRISVLNDWQPRNWLDVLTLLGLVVTGLELIQVGFWVDAWVRIAGYQPPPIGFRSSGLIFGHPNVFAGFLNLIMPFQLVKLLNTQDWKGRLSHGLIFGFLGLGLFFTSSRGGWLAGVSGIVLTCGFFVAIRGSWKNWLSLRDQDGRLRTRKLIGVTMLALIIVTLAAVGYWQVTSTGHASPLQSRLPVWDGSVQVIKQSPLLGSGLRSFPASFAALGIDHHEEDIPHAHNIVLQYWSEFGIAGIAFLFAFVLLGFKYLYQRLVRLDHDKKVAYIPYVGALAAAISHHGFDYLLGSPLYLGSLLIVFALALGGDTSQTSDRPELPNWKLAFTLGILLAITSLLYLQADNWQYWRGVQAAAEGNWAEAENLLCKNFMKFPSSPSSAAACQLASSLTISQNQFLETPSLAAAIDDHWHQNWENAAFVFSSNGELQAAIESQKNAVARAPHREGALLGLAYLLEKSGETAEATESYQLALRENANLVDNFVIGNSTAAVLAVQDLRAEFNQNPPDLAWQVRERLHQNDFASALDILNRASPSYKESYQYYLFLAETYLGLGKTIQAREVLEIADFIRPNSYQINWLRSRLAEQENNQAEADRLLLLLLENLVISTDSRRYYFAAHGRASLPIDQVPSVLRPEITREILEAAIELGKRTEDPYHQSIIEWTILSAGVR